MAGASHPLPQHVGAAVVRSGGASAAHQLPLTALAGVGRPTRTGGGSARLLGLLRGPAVGRQDGVPVYGFAFVRVIPLAGKPSTGHAVKQASGLALMRALSVGAVVGGKRVRAAGRGEQLPLAVRRPGGHGLEWRFVPPTEDRYTALRERTRLVASVTYGLTTWRDPSGGWHHAFSPNPDRLVGATRIYRGGYQHPLLPDEIAELTAGGYAAHLTLTEI